MMGIYSIINTVNGKIYIGSSVDLKKRKYTHFTELRSNKHANKKLQYSFNKHGEENFKWEVVQEVNVKELLTEIEQIYLDLYFDSGRDMYNICKNANSMLGFKMPREAVEKLRKKRIGKKASEETKRKMSASQKGRKHTDDTKEAMRISKMGSQNPMYANTHSPEAIEKIRKRSNELKNTPKALAALELGRKWALGKKFTDEHRQKLRDAKAKSRKKIIRFDPLTQEEFIYESLNSVKKDNFHTGHVTECCKGIVKKHKGYIWRYA